jgi:hypothetical protein
MILWAKHHPGGDELVGIVDCMEHRAGPAKSEAECTTSETQRWDALDGP